MAEKESIVSRLNEFVEKRDFEGALALVRERQDELAAADRKLQKEVGEALKKTTVDRLLLSFADAAKFGERPFKRSLLMLEKLIGFKMGTLVLSKAWGLGKVRKLDYFYKRITVDFKVKKGHQFNYEAAAEMLERAPEKHILVLREADPAAFETLLKDKPADFLKEVIRSNGSSMTLIKLEDYCVANGFVKAVNWKAYWDRARVDLKKDACVVLPVKKTEPIELKAAAENYGGGWLTAFAQETDPKLILAAVREYEAQGKLKAAEAGVREKIGERLVFAATAARNVDDALYARIACTVAQLGFANPPASEMREYLWARKRFIKAAAALPAREVGAMIAFLAADEAARAKLYAAIPEFCFTAVTEVVAQFKDTSVVVGQDENGADRVEYPCRKAIGEFMKLPTAPATLTTLIVGKIEKFGTFRYGDVTVDDKKITVLKSYALWPELPQLVTLLAHAIALGEGRRGGETLKMQNLVRRLFGDKAWLEKMFKLLSPADRTLFFERFQASIAWDPSTHHTTVIRMTKLEPSLEGHLVRLEKKKEYARVTSYRSFALRKADYLKLINEDMPENVRKIEFAKGFGDLSENAEYQYAKDEQRQLMQKQTLMQAELEAVKPGDFADATCDEVMPGVSVVVATKDGEKTWTVLGEWDNDLEKGILSSKTRVAQNMLGKKVGDDFELPDADGNLTFATVKAILPLSDEIRAWIQVPAGMQI